MDKITLSDFIQGIDIKDVEGNRTYISAQVNGCKYGQSYANHECTREDMIRRFACFYYPFTQSDDYIPSFK